MPSRIGSRVSKAADRIAPTVVEDLIAGGIQEENISFVCALGTHGALSRVELRKVIWPNRQETVQTAVAVIIFTIVMALFFWVLDKFLFWATRLLTGQGG